MGSWLFDPTLQGLSQVMTLRQRQHEVISGNLANLDTPGFRARELDFKSALRDAFTAAEQGTSPATPPTPVEDRTAPARADGNTVDLDLQMTKLTANCMEYVALAKLLGLRIALLRQAIEGSR
jgi:flagellar basal-body rod protein FlgB